jgi:mRNA interferase RelE/StbE
LKVEFRESFLKDLHSVRDGALRRRIKRKIESVENTETTESITGLKRLQGHNDYFRIRLGDYRIGLKIESDTIYFVRFLHRREIYRFFP